jgi:hypothetical protein
MGLGAVGRQGALTAFWVSQRDLSRASVRLAQLAALAALPGKSTVVDGKKYVTDMPRSEVDVRPVTKGF